MFKKYRTQSLKHLQFLYDQELLLNNNGPCACIESYFPTHRLTKCQQTYSTFLLCLSGGFIWLNGEKKDWRRNYGSHAKSYFVYSIEIILVESQNIVSLKSTEDCTTEWSFSFVLWLGVITEHVHVYRWFAVMRFVVVCLDESTKGLPTRCSPALPFPD